MLEKILFSEAQLSPYDVEMLTRARSLSEARTVDIDNQRYGVAFVRYLLFTYWPELILEPGTDTDKRCLYNRYYWFQRFARAYCHQHGPDAGLDQQALQMLEHSGVEIDWQVVEEIEAQMEEG